MKLSSRTFQNLADALAPEMVDSIITDERYAIFLNQLVPELLQQKLGPIDEGLKGELTQAIMDRICMEARL